MSRVNGTRPEGGRVYPSDRKRRDGAYAFLRGAGRLIDFGGRLRDYDGTYRDGPAADARAMRRDWSHALRHALRHVASEKP